MPDMIEKTVEVNLPKRMSIDDQLALMEKHLRETKNTTLFSKLNHDYGLMTGRLVPEVYEPRRRKGPKRRQKKKIDTAETLRVIDERERNLQERV